MKTTVIGVYEDFASASRASAALMRAGFGQAEISIVGHEASDDGSRFAYAGALARTLTGAREHDFAHRLVDALARMGVPPRQASEHADRLRGSGGLVAIQVDEARARQGESVMGMHGVTGRYVIGAWQHGPDRAHPASERALAAA